MKKIISLSLALVFTLLLSSACKKYEDMPPIPESNQANRLYKIKDPRPMTPDEVDKEKDIRDEYNKNTQ